MPTAGHHNRRQRHKSGRNKNVETAGECLTYAQKSDFYFGVPGSLLTIYVFLYLFDFYGQYFLSIFQASL